MVGNHFAWLGARHAAGVMLDGLERGLCGMGEKHRCASTHLPRTFHEPSTNLSCAMGKKHRCAGPPAASADAAGARCLALNKTDVAARARGAERFGGAYGGFPTPFLRNHLPFVLPAAGDTLLAGNAGWLGGRKRPSVEEVSNRYLRFAPELLRWRVNASERAYSYCADEPLFVGTALHSGLSLRASADMHGREIIKHEWRQDWCAPPRARRVPCEPSTNRPRTFHPPSTNRPSTVHEPSINRPRTVQV